MDKVYLAKVKEGAIIPTKRLEDAGYDLYACFDSEDVEGIFIPPHSNALIPTGIASAFDSKYVGIIKERGSTGYKNMAVRAGVIDSGFRNEWMVIINNTGDIPILITNDMSNSNDIVIMYPASKAIAQVVFQEVPLLQGVEVEYDVLMGFESERGLGMLGDSGK